MPTPPPIPAFVVGVHAQPPESYAKWATRGINTLFVLDRRNGTIPQAEARAAARAAGLFYVDLPSADLAADVADPWLLGWVVGEPGASTYYDEPDRASDKVDPATGKNIVPRVPIGQYQAAVARLKAAAGGSGKWIMAAMSSDITNAKDAKPPYDGHNHRPFLAGCTHGTESWYPCNKNAERYLPAKLIGAAIGKLAEFGPPGLVRGAYLECSDQMLDGAAAGGRAPTAAELEGEVAEALGAGAQFLVWFPQRPLASMFSYDNLTPEQALSVQTISKRLGGAQQPAPDGPTVAQRLDKVEEIMGGMAGTVARLQGRLDAMVRAGAGLP